MRLIERVKILETLIDSYKQGDVIDSKNLYDLSLHLSFIKEKLDNAAHTKDWITSNPYRLKSEIAQMVDDLNKGTYSEGVILHEIVHTFLSCGYIIINTQGDE